MLTIYYRNTRGMFQKVAYKHYYQIDGSGNVGDANLRRRWRYYRLSFCMAFGILGKIDESRNDLNAYDKTSYDACATLPEQLTNFGLKES